MDISCLYWNALKSGFKLWASNAALLSDRLIVGWEKFSKGIIMPLREILSDFRFLNQAMHLGQVSVGCITKMIIRIFFS